jgi:hypothetical protein
MAALEGRQYGPLDEMHIADSNNAILALLDKAISRLPK